MAIALTGSQRGKVTNAPLRLRFIPYNARLVDARKAKGLTQKDMSILTGLNRNSISPIETLRIIPSSEAMEEIAAALELPVDYLFPSSLMEAIKDGLFGHRVAELKEAKIISLTEARRSGMLPAGITQHEAEVALDEHVDALLQKEDIRKVLELLKPRDRKVLELRFGFRGPPMALSEVAEIFNVTTERIRQIEARAFRNKSG